MIRKFVAPDGKIVNAVLVTNANMQKVANWCRGAYYCGFPDPSKNYIRLSLKEIGKYQDSLARVGEWIVESSTLPVTFYVFTDEAFTKRFNLAPTDEHPETLDAYWAERNALKWKWPSGDEHPLPFTDPNGEIAYAVRVTGANMVEVAKWCHGSYRCVSSDPLKNYIRTRLLSMTPPAYVGDWVVEFYSSPGTFYVYDNNEFAKTFKPAPCLPENHGTIDLSAEFERGISAVLDAFEELVKVFGKFGETAKLVATALNKAGDNNANSS
jgi:hypothetical protein